MKLESWEFVSFESKYAKTQLNDASRGGDTD